MGVPALVAGLIFAVGVAINVAMNFAMADGAGAWPWLVLVLLTLIGAMLTYLQRSASRSERRPAPRPTQHGPHDPYRDSYGYARPRRRPRRELSLAVVVLVFLLIGGGAAGAAYGGYYAVGWLTCTDSGEDLLAQPASVSASGLTVEVNRVVVTAHCTKVGLRVTNDVGNTLSLPLFHNCTLNAGGSTMDADSFRSDWSETIAHGGVTDGTIVFRGKPSATTATLTFATVFEQGFDGPDSITVSDIPLHAG